MTWPAPASRAEILRILEINRNLYTEWVITRAETEAVLALLRTSARVSPEKARTGGAKN